MEHYRKWPNSIPNRELTSKENVEQFNKILKHSSWILRCDTCKDIIYSSWQHNFVECFCGSVFVDGWKSYFRFWGSGSFTLFDKDSGEFINPFIKKEVSLEEQLTKNMKNN